MQVINGIDEADWPLLKNIVVEVADEDGRLAATEGFFRRHGMEVDVKQMPGCHGTDLHLVFAGR
ncbi:hypothetical protein [Streptomyces sp. NPDC014685]|uniref:hypothetical protein n=1 Tax=Streptomyces sp. NPDC014685 TaxID=3364881 RepID=UPI0036FF4201